MIFFCGAAGDVWRRPSEVALAKVGRKARSFEVALLSVKIEKTLYNDFRRFCEERGLRQVYVVEQALKAYFDNNVLEPLADIRDICERYLID